MGVTGSVSERYSHNNNEEKIKVEFAKIAQRMLLDGQYYVIIYREVGADYCTEGYGSYDLNIVNWYYDNCFEIVGDNKVPEKIVMGEKIWVS